MPLVKLNSTPKALNGFMDDFFNDLPTVFGKTLCEDINTLPQVNITEYNDGYTLELNVPGRKKEDFKIYVDNKTLTISYEKKVEQNLENRKQIRREFSLQSFKRTFTFVDKIAMDKISANYENGLLIVNLAKKDELKFEPKEIQIK